MFFFWYYKIVAEKKLPSNIIYLKDSNSIGKKIQKIYQLTWCIIINLDTLNKRCINNSVQKTYLSAKIKSKYENKYSIINVCYGNANIKCFYYSWRIYTKR